MQSVNHQLVSLALERVDGTTFENFFHAFYSSLTGIQFIPLGGTHDGGADAFHGDRIFEGRAGVFYQATTEEGHASKIRRTVDRLREYGRDPSTLHFVISRVVTSIDKEEEALSEEFDLNVKIRDRKWITSNINDSPKTIAAFHSFLEPTLSFLRELGGATTIQQNVPARTLCVFLGQEIDRRRGDTELLEAVTDSLILWSLEGTDPDCDIFMTRPEILDKIESALPSAKHFVRNAFDDRIATMASKGNPTGREIRWYRHEDKFCLPFDTRTTVTQENTNDGALRLTVTELYERRARDLLGNDGSLGVRLSNRMREQVFHDVMERAKKIREVDESRSRAMMADLSNRLKGDNYKQYEAELTSGPLALPRATQVYDVPPQRNIRKRHS